MSVRVRRSRTSGTVMWVVQARKLCPHCGKRFGFGLYFLKPYQCRNCGQDVPEATTPPISV